MSELSATSEPTTRCGSFEEQSQGCVGAAGRGESEGGVAAASGVDAPASTTSTATAPPSAPSTEAAGAGGAGAGAETASAGAGGGARADGSARSMAMFGGVPMQAYADSKLSPTEALEDPVVRPLLEKWMKQQEEYRTVLSEDDDGSFSVPGDTTRPTSPPLTFVGGVDISFVKGDAVTACAALVVVRLPDLSVVYESFKMVKLTMPYISGFLAFRECEFLVDLIDEVRRTKPEVAPQLIMVDGNGVLHPRRLGLACQLGIEASIPTIGIGKTFLHVDGLTKDKVKALAAEENKVAGDAVELVGDSGQVWGAAYKSTNKSKNPIYVSVGHNISLNTAIAVARLCSRYRVPEPVRQADLRSRDYLRDNPPLTDGADSTSA